MPEITRFYRPAYRAPRADYPVLPGRDPSEATAWLRFVIDHRNPRSLRFHVLAATTYWSSLVAFVITHHWAFIIPWTLSAGFGVVGHVVTREGSFGIGRPHQVVWFATKLATLVLLGRYRPHIERAEALFGRDCARWEAMS